MNDFVGSNHHRNFVYPVFDEKRIGRSFVSFSNTRSRIEKRSEIRNYKTAIPNHGEYFQDEYFLLA